MQAEVDELKVDIVKEIIAAVVGLLCSRLEA
jgi:hypothetical protein